MSNRLVVFGILIFLFMIGIIFIPVIFGSMEHEMNLSNNTSHAVYNQTTPMLMTGQTMFWVGGFLCAVLLLAGILLVRRR